MIPKACTRPAEADIPIAVTSNPVNEHESRPV